MYPENKEFAFTIIDDTDNANCANIVPIYNLFEQLGLRTTKTTWVFPAKDNYRDTQTLADPEYKDFLLRLSSLGFEIASHSVSSGSINRDQILEGFSLFKKVFGNFPKIHINHSRNPDNIYWNYSSRLAWPFSRIMTLLSHINKKALNFSGEFSSSAHFWGDFCKENIKYIRNLTFSGVNTLNYDPKMPYFDRGKEKYSNYWFSSTDAHTVEEFLDVITFENIDKLERQGGCCIIYTHLAEGFVSNGKVHPEVIKRLKYLSKKNGWFVPASEVLDFLNCGNKIGFRYRFVLSSRWLLGRISKYLRFGR